MLSPLDKHLQNHILTNFDNITKGKTLVMASHYLKVIHKFDRLIVLDSGKLDGIGTHDELLKTSELYSSLWNLETS